MTLIARRKRPLDRSVAHLRDTRLVIIATEGHTTEKQYFSIFHSTRVQVQVLPTREDNRSSPEQVLERLRKFREAFDLGGDDELWLMVDVDRWGDAKLAQVAREAKACGFNLAVSNPCFEVWLLFHHVEHIEATDRCCDVEDWLRAALGGSYNKSRLVLEQFQLLVKTAMTRAEANDAHPKSRWPHHTGTHVYRVVRNLPID